MSAFKTHVATASVSALFLLAACGEGVGNASSGTTTAASATKTDAEFDPCSLIGSDQIGAITTSKIARADRDGATCHYRSALDQAVQVTIYRSGGAERMQTVHRASDLLGGMGQSVADEGGAGADVADLLKKDSSAKPKLGDEAVWGMNSTLSVRQGDAFVEVTPPLLHDPATHSGHPMIPTNEKRAIATKVATAVLAKL